MVGSGITLNLFEFQEEAVLKLLDMTTDSNEKQITPGLNLSRL